MALFHSLAVTLFLPSWIKYRGVNCSMLCGGKSTDRSYELHSLTRRPNINASNTQLNWTHSSRWLIALYIVWMAPRKILCLYLTWPMQKQYTTAGAQPRKSKATFWVFWFSFFPNFFPRYGIQYAGSFYSIPNTWQMERKHSVSFFFSFSLYILLLSCNGATWIFDRN